MCACSNVVYVNEAEWSVIQRHFNVDVEIRRDVFYSDTSDRYETLTPGNRHSLVLM